MNERDRLKEQLLDTLLAKEGVTTSSGDKITPRDKITIAPLSFAQQRLWFLAQMDPTGLAYNIPLAIKISGPLNLSALSRSIQTVVHRHHVLRAIFTNRNGEIVQEFLPASAFSPSILDLSASPKSERMAMTLHKIHNLAQQPFDLAHGPLFKVTLFRLDSISHIFLILLHHIVADNWSYGVLLREIKELYLAYNAGKASALQELPIQYSDFAEWQRQKLTDVQIEPLLEYWRNQLREPLPITELPTDYPRTAVSNNIGAQQSFVFDRSLPESLKLLGHDTNSTLFMLILAGISVLLSCYTGQDDVVIGSPVANRNRSETMNLIGYFVNALVLRIDLSGDPKFLEIIARVRDVALNAYAHQDIPFEKVVESLRINGERSDTPFFRIVFNFQNAPTVPLELPGLELTYLDVGTETTKYDLTFYMWESDGCITGKSVYRSDLFRPTTIDRIHVALEAILNRVTVEPDMRLSTLRRIVNSFQQDHTFEKQEQRSNDSRKHVAFKRTLPKLIQQNLVNAGYLESGQTLPLLIESSLRDFDLIDWAKQKEPWIENELLKHGAILFRNFSIGSTESFEGLAAVLANQLENYVEISSPHLILSNRISIPAEYPPASSIPPYNELSYNYEWPSRVVLWCVHAPRKGGKTSLVSTHKVFETIKSSTRKKFIDEGVKYITTLQNGFGIGLSWQTVFKTQDRSVISDYCRKAKIEYEWIDNGRLWTSQLRRAVIDHPQSGDPLWFNQAYQWRLLNFVPSAYPSRSSASEKEFISNIYYGDNSAIDSSVLEEIGNAYQQALVTFPLQQGDILLIENMLVAHGQMPFVGSRKVLVAMGATIKEEDTA